MRVTLVLNPNRLDSGARERMIAALRRRGDTIRVVSSNGKLKALRDPGDLVIVAGGDGTVAKIARKLQSRKVPIHILPIGTSNNIARSLGIRRKELDLDVVRAEWKRQKMDAIAVDGELIIESAGCGAIARLMRHAGDANRKGPRHEKRTLSRKLKADFPLFKYRVTAGRKKLKGEALLIEVMVIRQVGPRVVLAPDARPGDGLLDLVIAGDKQRAKLQRYLRSLRRPPKLQVIRARKFTLECKAPWHFDDKLKPRRKRTMTVVRHAWTAMVPRE